MVFGEGSDFLWNELEFLKIWMELNRGEAGILGEGDLILGRGEGILGERAGDVASNIRGGAGILEERAEVVRGTGIP